MAQPSTHPAAPARRVFLTGATGYVGGRLAPRLLEQGFELCCVVRSARKMQARPWADDPRVRIVEADMLDVAAMTAAMRGCEAAYYLVHSMQASGREYAQHDRDLAAAFAQAAERAGVGRIIYLGGLGEMGANLSEHLSSRREVERVLAGRSTPVTVFRAAMVIGSGSASFEILRYLVERLPVMVTPRWVSTQCQPIAIDNVIHYLTACLDVPATIGRTLDIGGAEVMSYRRIMQETAEALGLRRRWIVAVPVLTPRLSSMWIHLVTPISYRLARPLAEGLRNRVVCRDDEAQRLMPQTLLTVRQSIDAALGSAALGATPTAWSDAGVITGDPDWAGGKLFVDERTRHIAASAGTVFEAVCKVGGGHGYYAADWLWRLRGWLDRLVGGPGLRRGRRHPQRLCYGDALDFWRVIEVDAPRRLTLLAEMKLPGVAALQFTIEPNDAGDGGAGCTLHQVARFKPRGLLGLAYWYAVLPLHHLVFRGMLRGISRQAEANGSRPATTHSGP